MNGRVWTFSNFLSILRILLLIPVSALLLRPDGDRLFIIVLLLLIVLTDYFDGAVARKYHQGTDAGKILDPLADKIGVFVICSVLMSQGRMPVWFFLAAIARDGCILLGGFYVKRVKGVLLQSNIIGKWTITVIAAYILVAVLDLPELASAKIVLLTLSSGMMLLSLILYGKRFREVLQ